MSAPRRQEGEDIPSPSSYANYPPNEPLLEIMAVAEVVAFFRQLHQSLLRSCSISCCRLASRNLTLVVALSSDCVFSSSRHLLAQLDGLLVLLGELLDRMSVKYHSN